MLIDQEITLASTKDGLLCWPEEWTDELIDHGFLEAASAILSALPRCALKTPWIIGSASKTLFGKPRTESQSHMTGKAFDMSPMYSRDQILDPDGRIMGLAWNVVSLHIIGRAFKKVPHFVVEGDHLHVQPDAVLPTAGMLAAFTMPSWYEWTDDIRGSEEERALDNSFWRWDQEELVLALADNQFVDDCINALRVEV